MTSVDELTRKAKAGDLQALQQLRDQGFFRAGKAAEGYPVSHAQRRLWIVDQMGGGFGAYNIPVGLRLNGALNAAALRRAVQNLMRRHESLRTTFATVDVDLRQFIHEELELPWKQVDLSDDPARERRAHQIAHDEAMQRFDLMRGPLFSTMLMRLAPDRHLFLLNIHHIVSDLASVRILLHELSVCYRTCASDSQPRLAPLPSQYREFAVWQNRMLVGPEAARHRSYWLDRLAMPLPPLELPADRPRPALKTFNGKVCRAFLDAALTKQLRQLGLRHGLTLFMILAASLKVLLYRYTGQTDIIVGCPVAGREHPDATEQVGCFVNMLALRDRLDPDDSFVTALGKIRQTMLDAYEHQAYPFDKLVEELALPRDMSRSPVFDISLSLAHAEEDAQDLDDLELSAWEQGYAASKFDMSFDFFEMADGLELAITYNTDLFADGRVGRMADHYVRLVRGAVQNPEQTVGRMPMLSPAERHQVVTIAAPTITSWHGPTVVDLFERQAALRPDEIALIFPARSEDVSPSDAGPRQTMSYGELNARVNRLAHRLRRLGVGPDVLVGLCLPRSLDLVVGLLGILKAGGAYLPLDTAHPPERWAYMLDDARATVVVTLDALAETFATADRPTVCLDRDGASLADESAENPPPVAGPDHLAYVIYTSGSTGRPKGVAVTHRNVARLFTASAPLFAFDAADVWTLFHSCAFDFSVWELWGALVHGGRLVVVPHWVTRSPDAFYAVLAQEGVTVLNQTPSAFRQLMQVEDDADACRPLALRTVIFGGEALEFASLRPWFARHGDATPRLINMYGITETTVHVTFRPVSMADVETTGSRIGKPLPHLKLYLLDANREPVPIGVPGELYVGGGGVSAGYLHRPELTAERFVPDPFDPDPQARLYRTGDLARFIGPDHDIEYLGRIDHQVQIRGFRVELGEIETTLAAHPGIRDAIVLADGQGADMRLIGYFIPTGEPPTAAALRSHLQGRLPDYMIPAAFIPVPAFRLTLNGKIDRTALPKPESARSDLSADPVVPRNDLEQVLASFFTEILRIDRVGVDGNFFDLGGNSLLAIRMISRIRETFRVEINIPEFFHAANAAALAAAVRTALPPGQADKVAQAVLRLKSMSMAEKQELLDRATASRGPTS